MARPFLLLLVPLVIINQSAALSASAKSAVATPKSESGWHVEQKSSMLSELIIDMTPSYFRMENKRAGTITMASAPGWQVTTYNKQRQIYYQTSLEKFKGSFAFWSGSLSRFNMTNMQFTKGKEHLYKGVLVQRMTEVKNRAEQLKEAEEELYHPTVDILEDAKLPTVGLHLLCKLYFMPAFKGLPVESQAGVLSSIKGRNKNKVMMATSVLKAANISIERLPDLSGYKKMADESSFANANNGGSLDIKDFTDYMGD